LNKDLGRIKDERVPRQVVQDNSKSVLRLREVSENME
jgi:hypothetical protein